MNKVLLIGRISNDVKLFQTTSGIPYARATIAVNRRNSSKENQQTDFISLVAWRNVATLFNDLVSKGVLVSIEGQITTGQYQGQNGTVWTTDVTVENFTLLESRQVRQQRQNSVSTISPRENYQSNQSQTSATINQQPSGQSANVVNVDHQIGFDLE